MHHLRAFFTFSMLATACWAFPGTVLARDVQNGDTYDDVKYALGNPRGEVRTGDQLLLIYDRGTVELYQGYVVSMDLVSAQEATARIQARRVAAAERSREEAARRAQLQAEGEAELERIRADEAFKKKTVAEQVAYWEDFIRKYPDVAISEEYEKTADRLKEEQTEEEARLEEQRLSEQVAGAPTKRLSSRQLRRERRRLDPTKPVVTAPYTPPYRPLGAEVSDDWPY